jgi:hypothetical protein
MTVGLPLCVPTAVLEPRTCHAGAQLASEWTALKACKRRVYSKHGRSGGDPSGAYGPHCVPFAGIFHCRHLARAQWPARTQALRKRASRKRVRCRNGVAKTARPKISAAGREAGGAGLPASLYCQGALCDSLSRGG